MSAARPTNAELAEQLARLEAALAALKAPPPAAVDDPSLLAAQARRNALRTFLQGLAIDVLVAVALLVTQLIAAPLSAWQGWTAIGVALARTVLGAAASYVMRRFVDGSRIPTPLPIAPVAAPAETEDGVEVPAG